jgi:hypothetical protein
MCVSPNVLKIVWLKSLPENIDVIGYVKSRSWRHHWVNFCDTYIECYNTKKLCRLKILSLTEQHNKATRNIYIYRVLLTACTFHTCLVMGGPNNNKTLIIQHITLLTHPWILSSGFSAVSHLTHSTKLNSYFQMAGLILSHLSILL